MQPDTPTLRQLIPPNTRLLSFEIDPSPAADNSGSTRWHQIGVEGEWSGHWQGAFSLTERDFEQIVTNKNSQAVDIPCDYEHRSVFAMFGGDSRASGWIDELQVRQTEQGAGLFARIKWTDRAASAIRAREYRYVSPSINWKTPDRKTGVDTGVSLQSLALTNTPFLEELPEVTLNSLGRLLGADARDRAPAHRGAKAMNDEQIAQLATILTLSAETPAAEVIAAAELYRAAHDGLGAIRDALQLSAEADSEAIVAGIKALCAERDEAPDPTDFAALQAQVGKMRAESALSAARAQGKIVAQNEAWATSLAESNLDAFNDWAKSAPAVVPVEPKRRKSSAPASSLDAGPSEAEIHARVAQLSSTELDVVRQLNLTPEAYVKHNFDRLGN